MGTIWKRKKQRRIKKKSKTTNRLDSHRPSQGRSWWQSSAFAEGGLLATPLYSVVLLPPERLS
jgi:hypothetical protein